MASINSPEYEWLMGFMKRLIDVRNDLPPPIPLRWRVGPRTQYRLLEARYPWGEWVLNSPYTMSPKLQLHGLPLIVDPTAEPELIELEACLESYWVLIERRDQKPYEEGVTLRVHYPLSPIQDRALPKDKTTVELVIYRPLTEEQ